MLLFKYEVAWGKWSIEIHLETRHGSSEEKQYLEKLEGRTLGDNKVYVKP